MFGFSSSSTISIAVGRADCGSADIPLADHISAGSWTFARSSFERNHIQERSLRSTCGLCRTSAPAYLYWAILVRPRIAFSDLYHQSMHRRTLQERLLLTSVQRCSVLCRRGALRENLLSSRSPRWEDPATQEASQPGCRARDEREQDHWA